jgi:glycosyltransferase involved in cell wall biosynthesis
MRPSPLIIAAIPAYNEEETIAKVIIKTSKYVDKVVVVDDGSTDMTAEIAERLGAQTVRHLKNMGYGVAIASCFKEAKRLGADILITLDADGQHDPEDIPQLLKPLLEGSADIVIGSRLLGESQEMPRYRKAGVKVITKLTEDTAHLGVRDAQSGFRAYNKKAIERLSPTERGMGASLELLVMASENNLKVVEVPIVIKYKGLESSTHNPIIHGLDLLFTLLRQASIRRPALFYGIPAMIFIAIGIIFGLWAVSEYTVKRYLVTNLALIAVASTIVGLILGTTAIILFTLISIISEKR